MTVNPPNDPQANRLSANTIQKGTLPYLYGKWIEQFLQDAIPVEQAATCDTCAMCSQKKDGPNTAAYYFNPATKCCTYIPELPNFLIGAILASVENEMALGRDSVTRRLTAGVGVTPLGISPPPDYTLLYRNSPAGFGRSQSLNCPHYVSATGRCAIWQYRAPPCITWFCKHNRGAVGRDFWRELQSLLVAIQQSIAVWCMTKIIDTETLRTVLNQPQRIDQEINISGDVLDGKANEAWLRDVWGDWYGCQEEFYQSCAHLAEQLEWHDVAALGGAEVQARALIVKAAYHKLTTNDVPDRPRTGGFQVVNTAEDYLKVTTYSPYDPLDIPKSIMDALAYFDGRPLTEALDIITRQKNIPFNSKVLHSLLDFGVLVENQHCFRDKKQR